MVKVHEVRLVLKLDASDWLSLKLVRELRGGLGLGRAWRRNRCESAEGQAWHWYVWNIIDEGETYSPPAAMHFSLSPLIALAVKHTIRGLRGGVLARDQA